MVIITSDNPRTENPADIADGILAGLASHPNAHVELDRAKAIRHAITDARERDVVLICGKGHETEQIIGTTRKPFSDHAIAIAAHAQRK